MGLYATFLENPSCYLPAVQAIRSERDPGLAYLHDQLSPVVNAHLFDMGAAVTYVVMRQEIDRTNRKLRVYPHEVNALKDELIGDIEQRKSGLIVRTPIEEAERIVSASQRSLTDIVEFGPELQRYLAVYEKVIKNTGFGVDHKLFYMLGSISQAIPFLKKLGITA